MADNKNERPKHKLILDARESLELTGITDVVSFDDEQVIADTVMGLLIIKGSNLHVSNLNLGSGQLSIFGEFNSIGYEEQGALPQKSTLFSRLFK